MARRFYLNQIVAVEDKPFDRGRWDDLERPNYTIQPGALITLGFDSSQTRDHTVLIGTEVTTGYQWVAGYWEPERTADDEYRINVAEVDATVAAVFERWRIWRFNADPFYGRT